MQAALVGVSFRSKEVKDYIKQEMQGGDELRLEREPTNDSFQSTLKPILEIEFQDHEEDDDFGDSAA